MTTRPTLLLLSTAILLAACAQPPVDRSGKLLTMAGEEAASIPNKLDRLTRQLNIANTQLNTGRTADADKMLLLARDTLTSTAPGQGDLDDFHRIAAWTSISQLARRANDRDLALKSSDRALAALNDVQPSNQRPQYVLSLAAELADLQGQDAAVELVNSGGAWAADILEPAFRRQALIAFADRLLSYDAYENARTMLHRDPDPVWRTDTFLALANTNTGYYNATRMTAAPAAYMNLANGGGAGRGGRGGAAGSDMMKEQLSPASSFGRDVRFESVFQQGTPGN